MASYHIIITTFEDNADIIYESITITAQDLKGCQNSTTIALEIYPRFNVGGNTQQTFIFTPGEPVDLSFLDISGAGEFT